jgi:holo-[acyl-carrier protein] synthase
MTSSSPGRSPGPLAALARVSVGREVLSSNPVGVGIDLVDVTALRDLVEAGGTDFLASAWSAAELADCDGSVDGLAARWAAKEAVMKALGAGLGQVSPLDVEVRLVPATGAPRIELHRYARSSALDRDIVGFAVSLCHENGWATAIAVAVPRPASEAPDSPLKTEELDPTQEGMPK